MISKLLNWLFPPKPVSAEDRIKCMMWIRACVQGDIHMKKMDDLGYCHQFNSDSKGNWIPHELFKKLMDEAFHEAFRMSDDELLLRYANRYQRVRADKD